MLYCNITCKLIPGSPPPFLFLGFGLFGFEATTVYCTKCYMIILYSGKLSREKTFTAHFCCAKGCCTSKFCGETFAKFRKTTKFVKVFSLNSFPLCGINSWRYYWTYRGLTWVQGLHDVYYMFMWLRLGLNGNIQCFERGNMIPTCDRYVQEFVTAQVCNFYMVSSPTIWLAHSSECA